MSVLKQIAERKAAEAAAAAPPIQTGMASSQESPVVLAAATQEAIKQDEKIVTGHPVAPATPGAPSIDELADQAFIDSLPDNSYLGVRLKQLVLANGSRSKPDENGIFVPKSEEEQKMLDYFVSQGDHICRKLK